MQDGVLKQVDLDKSSFIAGWFLPGELCDEIVNVFEDHKHLTRPGAFGGTGDVDKNFKDSVDLSVYADYFEPPFDLYRKYLQQCLDNYLDIFKWCNEQPRFDIREHYNIQWYPVNGGFKAWHFENDTEIVNHRSLVFMTYLNDVPDGGTEFLYQDLKIPAQKGLTLLWPPFWTHTHRGIVSSTKEKMIVTGWFNFVDQFENKR